MSVTLEDAHQGLTLQYDASGRLCQAIVHPLASARGSVEFPLLHAHHPTELYSFVVCATFAGEARWAGSLVFSSCGGGEGQALLLNAHSLGPVTVETAFAAWPQQEGLTMPVLRVSSLQGIWTFHHC